MFQTFSAGDEFSSYSELATRISKFEGISLVQLYVAMLDGLEQSKWLQNVPQRSISTKNLRIPS